MNKYIITIFGECDEKNQLYAFEGTFKEAQTEARKFKNYCEYEIQTIEEFYNSLSKL